MSERKRMAEEWFSMADVAINHWANGTDTESEKVVTSVIEWITPLEYLRLQLGELVVGALDGETLSLVERRAVECVRYNVAWTLMAGAGVIMTGDIAPEEWEKER